MIQNEVLYHYGVKGQKWGVRRYQFADGSYTPAGKKRYFGDQSSRMASMMNSRVKEVVNKTRTQVTGRQYVDTYLKKGTTFSRIQSSKEFEKYAFYATYKKQDVDKYMGLFGKNLTTRAYGEAKRAAKKANRSGDENELRIAKELKSRADNMKVYQLKIETTKKLKVPSDENAGHITANLLKNSQFKNNVAKSIQDSKAKMKRPTQQVLFNQAQNALKKDPGRMTTSEKNFDL